MFGHTDITKDLSRAKKYFEDIISYTVGPFTLDEMIAHRIDSINIVDVREYNDYIEGHIPYAVHIPYKEAKDHVEMLDKDKVTVIYTYSDSCPRAYNSALELIEKHYPAVVLRGGFKEWKKFEFDIVKTDTGDYNEADKNQE
ncbi:MAG: rhodanese-like domain-containing protein [Candidatus Gastranaerophilales bacterium]|nr:rhodanese-like domain-containing protein [Candidatus Gastranaerophilales bacterium]